MQASMNSQVMQGEKRDYYEQGTAWERDVIKEAQRSRKIAWWVASIAVFISVLCVFAVILLTPLKTIEPIIVEVDKVTGEVKVKQHITQETIPQKEAVNKFFIHQYIQAREGFDISDIDHRYDTVTTMSNPQVAHEYTEIILADKNPNSPLLRFGKHGIIKVKVHNITFLADNTALVRFTKTGSKPQKQYQPLELNATISFDYLDTPSAESQRLISPLGFIVTRYRLDPVLPGQ